MIRTRGLAAAVASGDGAAPLRFRSSGGHVLAEGTSRFIDPAAAGDGPTARGNHDEDIRLRRAVPVQAVRVSAGAIHFAMRVAASPPRPHCWHPSRLPFPEPLNIVPHSHQGVMGKVLKAADAGENALLESPTGSGKSLALLCSGTIQAPSRPPPP